MRIAVVSDVHGNLTALEAVVTDLVRHAPDLVVHGGDLALMGPRPEEVIDLVRALEWPGVVGNTDQLLWQPEEQARQRQRAPALTVLLDLLFNSHAPDTQARLGGERLAWLRGLPGEYRSATSRSFTHSLRTYGGHRCPTHPTLSSLLPIR